jgi:hypothetical protein
LAQEIVARENISFQRLFTDKELNDPIFSDSMDKGEKIRVLRQYLKRRRFPELTRAETKFAKTVKKLALGSRVQLIAPKNFESPDYTLKCYFKNLGDLKKCQTTLSKLIQNPDLAAILRK